MAGTVVIATAALIWCACQSAKIIWALARWVDGFAAWHIHGKHCIYCSHSGRATPFGKLKEYE